MEDGTIVVNLISAKTKVAPIRQISIPRLELCAATLLAKLLMETKEALQLQNIHIFAWTDSTIVLSWLSSFPRRWNTFVANRTAEILEVLSRSQWRHVSSEDNPADCASRGIMAYDSINHRLWWRGPAWLRKDSSEWPSQSKFEERESGVELERKKTVVVHQVETCETIFDILNTNVSSFSKMVRFIYNCRKRVHLSTNCSSRLTTSEIKISTYQLIRWSQSEDFQPDIRAINMGKSFQNDSKLKSLKPLIDENKILRVGSRIENSLASYEVKHPIILSGKSQLAKKIVEEQHLKYLHAGSTLLINILKQRYWILGSRNLVRKIIHKCVTCTRYRNTPAQQMMGDLPEARVTFSRPFLKTGVDYAGPISLKTIRGRGQKIFKGCICIFVCLSIKAGHIELVSELTTDAFLSAFRRFTSRRGLCTDMYSDNGTNFVGADKALKELFMFIKVNSNQISNSLLSENIKWHFNPPGAPHFGGLWEAAVKATKYHMKRVLGNQILTYEEMSTLLSQIEAILNSRPLCGNNTNDDIDALTPSHFLLGHAKTLVPEPDLNHIKISKLSRWQMVQHMTQHFWSRWHREYLTALHQRSKWQQKNNNVEINNIVLIKDDNLPPNKWLIGRVVELHPGGDKLVRVVTIKTKTGMLKRPIQKICILPVC